MDITWIIELLLVVFIFIFQKKIANTAQLKQIKDIVMAVVAAANELDITGELIELGKTKAEYALEQAKTLLAKKNITFNEDELLVFIKSAVTEFRIKSAGTEAEKKLGVE